MRTHFYRLFQLLVVAALAFMVMPTFAQDAEATAEAPTNIDKVTTYDMSPEGLFTAEIGGERPQMVEVYNVTGQSTVLYLANALEEEEMAARWQMWGSRWEVTEFGMENPGFDLFENAVQYTIDRRSRNENISGLIVDMRGEQPMLVANLFKLTDAQIVELLSAHADTMDPESQEAMRRVTVNLLVKLDEAQKPVYVADIADFTAQNFPTCSIAVNAEKGVNIRSAASATASVLFVAEIGETMQGIAQTTVNNQVWYQVYHDGQDAFVLAEVVVAAGDCELLPQVNDDASTLKVLEIPVVVDVPEPGQANNPANPTTNTNTGGGNTPKVDAAPACTPAERVGNADDITVGDSTSAFVIDAWQPVEGKVLVPAGESVSGVKGANWKYSSTECAIADLTAQGAAWRTVSGGQIPQ